MKSRWEQLRAAAVEEIEATLAELPPELQERARAVPVTCEPRPNRAQLHDGIEPDTLGLFVGSDFGSQEISVVPLPPQIILFLENLWDAAENDEAIFREELRTTYMHELGHYLGLDEDDLFDRGLE